ncbi:MAG TPA: DNA-binding response regulator [Clostridiales bacterium]|nr:DNA-binding response regulator [Clostridiales bacterium]
MAFRVVSSLCPAKKFQSSGQLRIGENPRGIAPFSLIKKKFFGRMYFSSLFLHIFLHNSYLIFYEKDGIVKAVCDEKGDRTLKYTVLVVDDEEEQRQAFVRRVRWEAAGFEVVGEAENGVEALDLVEELEPDLILTDIRMPMISGLELAGRVREMRPATQIVILSGYDSFEYARTAIDYNIISYLLKPISSDEMSEALFEIHRKMDERLGQLFPPQDSDLQAQLKRLRINEFLLPLLLGSNESKQNDGELLARAKSLGAVAETVSTPRFCVLVSKFKGTDGSYIADARHTDFIGNIFGRHGFDTVSLSAYQRVMTLVTLPEGAKFPNLLELPLTETVQTARRLQKEHCTIGVSREFHALSDSSDAYFQAVTARRYTSDGAGDIRFINDQEKNEEFAIAEAEKTAAMLEQLLKVGTEERLSDFVEGLYRGSTPENANLVVAQIIATVCRVVGSLSDQPDAMHLLSSNPLFSRLTANSSEEAMKQEILDLCRRAQTLITQSRKRDSEVLCDRVIEIIDKRYSDEDLSLVGVSGELAVSPNYLSALIKKVRKKNFITLLTERRLRAAYDMLLCTNLRIQEITERCGYSDQHYFSYCFKKFYGESPNRVRQQKGDAQL